MITIRKNCFIGLLLVAFIFMLTSADAYADKKRYVWTIEYDTMERGEAELEHYFGVTTPDIGQFTGNTTVQQQIELEVGMSDRWDMRFYQVFSQKPNADFTYDGFKIETRYRLGEKGKYLFDPLLYFEYKNKPDFSQHKLEFKFVMAKDIGRFNIAFNPVFEIAEGKEDEDTEFEVKYAFGGSFELSRLLSVGIEFKGGESGHYFGPTISHGSERFWFALGTLFELADVEPGKPEFQMRTIFGIKF